jgi:hypothetical protein
MTSGTAALAWLSMLLLLLLQLLLLMMMVQAEEYNNRLCSFTKLALRTCHRPCGQRDGL